jgi:hypothetical protein
MTRKWSVPFISFIRQLPLPGLARNDMEKEVVIPAYLFSSLLAGKKALNIPSNARILCV